MRLQPATHGAGISRGGPPGRWWTDPALVQRLALTADQQKRIDALFQQNRLKLIDLSAEVQKEEAILEPLLEADRPDESQVLAQIDRIGAGARRTGEGQRADAAGLPRRADAGSMEKAGGGSAAPARRTSLALRRVLRKIFPTVPARAFDRIVSTIYVWNLACLLCGEEDYETQTILATAALAIGTSFITPAAFARVDVGISVGGPPPPPQVVAVRSA